MTHCLRRCFRKTLKEWINECHESENQTTSTPLRITKLPKCSRAWFVVFITFQYMMEISPSSPKSSITVTLPAEDINHVVINLQRNFPQSSIVYKLLLLLSKQRRHLVLPVSSHLKLRCVGKKNRYQTSSYENYSDQPRDTFFPWKQFNYLAEHLKHNT